jgi:three-Cys-motif partner protein
LKQDDDPSQGLFPEVAEPDVREFLDGSASIALLVEPRFSKYIFVEHDQTKAQELLKLCDRFPGTSRDIEVVNEEANTYLQHICSKSWKSHRAVLFLDPFGMQVSWKTMEAIARTKAIDTWILFPVGAVNRLLKRNAQIPEGWRRRLDTVFGEPNWFNVFFPKERSTLFREEFDNYRKVNVETIGRYYNQRLGSIFAEVAPNPLTLTTRKNVPLFLLCFAAANPKAAALAIRIAQDILRRES